MSSRVRQALSVILLASGIVFATACSDDPVAGGSQNLTVTITPSPAGSGRYTSATMIIKKLRALPVDPGAASVYGNAELLFRFDPNPFTLDLTRSTDTTFSNISLGTGTYKVTFLQFDPIVLIDENLSPTPASCIEGIAVIDGGTPASVPDTFTFTNAPSLNFTIQPGQTQLAMKINIPGLIAGYEASYTCTPGCGPGGSPCLTAFDEANFRAVFLANVTLE